MQESVSCQGSVSVKCKLRRLQVRVLVQCNAFKCRVLVSVKCLESATTYLRVQSAECNVLWCLSVRKVQEFEVERKVQGNLKNIKEVSEDQAATFSQLFVDIAW